MMQSGRDAYPGGGTRSPRSGRRLGELPTVDRSPSRGYSGGGGGGSSGYVSGRGSPLGSRRLRAGTRSGNSSPEGQLYSTGGVGGGMYGHHTPVHQSLVGLAGSGGIGGASPYYSSSLGGARDVVDELGSPVLLLEERGRSMSQGAGQHRSRSASRPAGMPGPRYASLDRASVGLLDHEREFVPIREPLSRSAGRYLEDELYGPPLRTVSQRQSPNPHMLRDGGGYIGELQHQNNDLQRELGNLKKELELTNQKLGSSMHSIKTFWSPELKKERALRKEESTKYSLINEQLKLLNNENQVCHAKYLSHCLSAQPCSTIIYASHYVLVLPAISLFRAHAVCAERAELIFRPIDIRTRPPRLALLLAPPLFLALRTCIYIQPPPI